MNPRKAGIVNLSAQTNRGEIRLQRIMRSNFSGQKYSVEKLFAGKPITKINSSGLHSWIRGKLSISTY